MASEVYSLPYGDAVKHNRHVARRRLKKRLLIAACMMAGLAVAVGIHNNLHFATIATGKVPCIAIYDGKEYDLESSNLIFLGLTFDMTKVLTNSGTRYNRETSLPGPGLWAGEEQIVRIIPKDPNRRVKHYHCRKWDGSVHIVVTWYD